MDSSQRAVELLRDGQRIAQRGLSAAEKQLFCAAVSTVGAEPVFAGYCRRSG